MTTASAQLDRTLGRITTHLRAHVAELRRLERAGAAPGELEERRELIARLQIELIRRWCRAAVSNKNDGVRMSGKTATSDGAPVTA